MRALIFDPFAGISGDMILGALVDLGLTPEWLERFVASLGLPDVGVRVGRAERQGISCGRVEFDVPEQHAHRHLRHVLEIVDRTAASERVKERARRCFARLADAEAAIHGIPAAKVHFHEVGALDAVLDVLCACAGFEELGFERFYARPVAVGSGWIEIAHGRFPVPAPATLKLLEGHAVAETSLAGECTTPTGAAILTTFVASPALPAEYVVTGSGYGAGSRDPDDRPNCLRLIACDVRAGTGEPLYMLQADVDDLPPEYVPGAQETLLDSGALDAVVLPVGMKKGRPAVRLEALVPASRLEAALEVLFRATTTNGARYWAVHRPALPREEETIEWSGERVRRKRVRLPGGGERTKLEYEDVARIARASGRSALEVRNAIERGLAAESHE